MFAYSITYGVYDQGRIFKTGTVGIQLNHPGTPEALKTYLQEAMSSMQDGYDVDILSWKEIAAADYERLYSRRLMED